MILIPTDPKRSHDHRTHGRLSRRGCPYHRKRWHCWLSDWLDYRPFNRGVSVTLSLPGCIEPHMMTDMAFERIRGAAVYCLELEPPEDIYTEWDQHFENRAPYLDEIDDAQGVRYVGAANDLLRRLNDHNDGRVRKAALLRVCDIESLHSVYWFDDPDEAFERESKIATIMQNQHPDIYIHSR